MVNMVQTVPSTGLSSQFKNIEEKCSCTKCDSLFCFTKRHFVDSCSCSCNNCKESKTCLFFTNRLVRVNESHSDATNAAPISAITSATGDNAHLNSKYSSSQKLISTNSNEAGFTSKQSSNTLTYTSKQPSYILAITNKQPSKTLAITHEPSAVANKPVAYGYEFGTKILGASETKVQSMYSPQKKPFDASQNTLKTEDSEIKHLSCCAVPIPSAIPTPEPYSCGHHRSAEIHRVPEQISCISKEKKPPSTPGYVLDLNTNKSNINRMETCVVMTCVIDDDSHRKNPFYAKNIGDCFCDGNASEFKSEKHALDSPGYILDLKSTKPAKTMMNSCEVKGVGNYDSNRKKTFYAKNIGDCFCDENASDCKSRKIAPDLSGSTKSMTDTCKVKCIENNESNRRKPHSGKNTGDNCCDESSSECKSAKLAPDSPGYIIDLKNKILCNCNESSKDAGKSPYDQLDSAGYVLDLTKGTQKQTRNPLEACKNIFANQINAIKALCNTCIPSSNPIACGTGARECKSAKHAPDSTGYVVNFKNKKPCDCNESQEKLQTPCCNEYNSKKEKTDSERVSRGYIFDVLKPFGTSTNKGEPKQIGCACNKQKLVSDPAGYVYDCKKKSICDCNEHKIMSDPPGYIYDTKKSSKLQRKTTCDCKDLPDNLTNPPGYVYMIPSQKADDKSNNRYGFRNRIKLQRKTTCDCKDLPDNLTNPPGYVYMIPSQKADDKTNNRHRNRLKLQRKTTCDCKQLPDNLTYPAGFVYKITLPEEKDKSHNQYVNQSKINKNMILPDPDGCSCTEPSNINKNVILPDPDGCSCTEPNNTQYEHQKYIVNVCVNKAGRLNKEVFENERNDSRCSDSDKTAPKLSKSISKSQESSAYKLELCKNILEIQKSAIETLDNLCLLQKDCCDFPSNQTGPPENNTKQEYPQKPASIKQQLCANILETELNAVGIMHDVTCTAQENTCSYSYNSQDDSKSLSCKEILKSVQETISKSESLRSKINNCLYSESSKYSCELNVSSTDTHKNKTESKKNRQKLMINYMETKKNGFESLKSSYKRTSCECNNKDSPGYLLEKVKSKEDPTNKMNENTHGSTSQKKKCECEESRKRLSSSAGYILELDQYKHEAFNKPRKLNKNSFELPKNTVESLTNDCQMKNCEKRLSSSAGYILELDQYKNDPLNKTRKLSKNLFDVQRNTIESLNNTNLKKGCECSEPGKKLSGSAGYILELTQYTNLPTNNLQRLTSVQEVKGDQSFNSACQKSCECKKPDRLSESGGHIVDLDKYKQELTTKPHKLSKNIFGIQKDTIELLTNPNQKKSCGCSDTRKRLSSSAGYILELQQFQNKLSNAPKDLSLTRVFNENSLHTPNSTCQNSCVCRKPSQIISDPPGYLVDFDQYKQKQVKHDKHNNNKCQCSQDKKNPLGSRFQYQTIALQVSNIQQKNKDISEINTNTTCQKSCVCRKPSKVISDPPGYVLDLDQYKQERGKHGNDKCKCSQSQEKQLGSSFELQGVGRLLPNIPKKISQDISEIKTNTTCQKSCVCRKPSKVISDPPGYVLDLDQYKQERGKHDNNKCKCSQEKAKPLGSAFLLQEIGRQLSNIPKKISQDISDIKTNTSCHKSCVCRKPSKVISDPPGYVYDLDQYKQERGKHDNNKCKCSQEKAKPLGSAFELQEIGRQLSNIPKKVSQDISEIKTNTTCQKSCVCRKPAKVISDPPGYVLDLDQYKQERGKHGNDKCKCSQSKEKQLGSSFELQGVSRQLPNIPKKSSQDISEIKTNTTCQKSCVCRKPSKVISDPPGYVLDLDQYKQERGKHGNDKCKCSQSKEKQSGSSFELQGVSRQLPNIPKKSSQDISEIKTNTTCQKSCVCRKPSKVISDPPGYVLDLDQYKQERGKHGNDKCKCSQSKEKQLGSSFELQGVSRQLPNIPKKSSQDISEIKTNTTCQKSCVCRKPSKVISDPPGYVLDLDQYKQERGKHGNDKCKCSQSKEKQSGSSFELQGVGRQLPNIPKKISQDISEIKTNTTCQKSCVCRKPSQIISDPPGYVYDLDQYKKERGKHDNNKCKCSQEKDKHETFSTSDHGDPWSANKTQVVVKNVFEIQRNTIETANNQDQKKCGCSDSRKRHSSAGYVFDLPQYAKPPSNTQHRFPKNTFEVRRSEKTSDCVCDGESQNKFSSSAGYILELEQYKKAARANIDESQSETCNCKDSSKKTFDPIPCRIGDMAPNENRFKRNVYESPKNPIDSSNSCNCIESPENNELGKIQGPTKNALEVCKNIFGPHMNTFDDPYNKNQKPCCDYVDSASNFNQTYKYALEIPKSSKNTLNEAKGSKSNFDLPDFLISLHKHVPTENILEMCKSILDKQDNIQSSNEEDGECGCESKKKKESILSAHENKQKNTYDLCNHLGTPSEIQKIKNIYMPPRYTLEYTKNYEYPGNNQTNDQPVKEVHSVKVSYSHPEATGTAMLSAQVMDLPFTDFHDSLSRKQEDSAEKANMLAKYDIFKRIKEAYRACTCKVCECIIGKSSTKNELCECKPCECQDCMSYLNKFKTPHSTSHGSSSKGHHKRVEPCDCKPCECVKCTHLIQPCDCEACQCEVCQRQKKVHKIRTLVVAPVGETLQRVACTCSPCDCIECGQGFPATSRMTNEMSTATNRHALCRCEVCLNDHCEHGGVDLCRCERQKGVINKPVEKDSHDYDIRTASVVHQNQVKKEKCKLCSKHNTLAMFAVLPYTFPTIPAKTKPSTKTCNCEECECVSCVCKENAINAIKSSQLFPSNKPPISSNYDVHDKSILNIPQNCNCTNCECEICDKYFDAQYCDSNVSIEQNQNCLCNVCDCINCAGETKIIKNPFDRISQCSTCQCTDCEMKVIGGMGHKDQCNNCRYENCYEDTCHSNQIVHPIKRGELLTPSTHKSKVQSLMLEKQRLSLPIPSNKSETLKCDTYLQCKERNRDFFSPKNHSIDNKISGSAFSGYSSFETSPITSCHKDYGGLTPVSQNKNISMESSCNSSGHDYPEYLIQFPKSTVETCLKDVMKLNMDKTIALDKFNIVPKKSSVKYQADSMSNELMLENDNHSHSHGCNVISSCDCKTVTAKCTESTNTLQYRNVSSSCMDRNRHAYSSREPDFIESTSCRNCKFEMKNDSRPIAFESLKTAELSYHNCSGCIEESTSSITVTGCETKAETRKRFHILQNFNDVHVACKTLECNTSEQNPNTLFQIKNEEFHIREYSKSLPQGNFGSYVDTLNCDEDYTRVQKTLKEAKEYSAELMHMLEMFDKANKEFESIADKLKIPQVSVSRDVDVEDDGMHKCVVKEEGFNEIEHELQEIPLEALSVREVLTSTSILQERVKPEITFPECENDINTISKKMGRTELTTISDYEKCNLPKGGCDLTYKLSTANENFPMQPHEICPDKAATEEIVNNSKDSMHSNKALHNPSDKGSIYYDTRGSTLDFQHTKKKDRINGKNYKKYTKLLKRTIIISKRVSLKNSTMNTPNPIVKYCITEGTSAAEMNSNSNNEKKYSITVNNSDKESIDSYGYNSQRKYKQNLILRKLNSVFGSEEVSVSTSTDTYGLERDFMSLNESGSSTMAQEFEEIRPLPILKKKYFNSKSNTKNKGVCIFPSLELQIKQAVQSISLQTSSTITAKKKSIIPHHENKALAKLQDEVKKLLDMPILQLKSPITCRDNTKESLNLQTKNKMELELKETPKVSFQSSWKNVKSVDKEVWCSFTREAVECLIKDLLHLSVMKPLDIGTDVLYRTTNNIKNNREYPRIISPKCSCDSLKVGFLGVRRVSDHTVLVKWNVPRKLAKVQGYELLVDGRPVQKIFSPSKSMAVVTCLPHTDKVLLTIRTITSSVSVTGHYPATTIVYRPRAK